VCAAVNKDTGVATQTGHGVGKAVLEIQATGRRVKNSIYGNIGQIEVHVLQAQAVQRPASLAELAMFGAVPLIQYVMDFPRPLLQLMQIPQLPKAAPMWVADLVAFTTQHFQKPLAIVFSHWDMFGVAVAVGAIPHQQVPQLVV